MTDDDFFSMQCWQESFVLMAKTKVTFGHGMTWQSERCFVIPMFIQVLSGTMTTINLASLHIDILYFRKVVEKQYDNRYRAVPYCFEERKIFLRVVLALYLCKLQNYFTDYYYGYKQVLFVVIHALLLLSCYFIGSYESLLLKKEM